MPGQLVTLVLASYISLTAACNMYGEHSLSFGKHGTLQMHGTVCPTLVQALVRMVIGV
jgi:hypothetical protein